MRAKRETKILGALLSGIMMSTTFTVARAETEGNVYVGFGLSSLALDSDRVVDVLTRSPSHTPKIGSLIVGYQFTTGWSLDLSLGTDFSGNVNTDQFALNGYRFFGDNKWKPFVSAGVSQNKINDATVNKTEQFQAGFGLSGELTDNLELRLGYQYQAELDDTSYNDDIYSISLNWHFRKPKSVSVARVTPQPESVPVKKEVAETIELLVQFEFDKSAISDTYKPQMEKIAAVLKANPDISITVEGHTSSEGADKYNQKLSERRADAVRNKFVGDYNIAVDRIKSIGYGETRPIADNNTSAGREDNRRAVAVILRKRKVAE